jgi:hypothetical protein
MPIITVLVRLSCHDSSPISISQEEWEALGLQKKSHHQNLHRLFEQILGNPEKHIHLRLFFTPTNDTLTHPKETNICGVYQATNRKKKICPPVSPFEVCVCVCVRVCSLCVCVCVYKLMHISSLRLSVSLPSPLPLPRKHPP